MAASGTAVTVLTPNGRRQAVKVSPNTPLLQVLEDVCRKHGFNPDDHSLKFQRTVIDLTVPWRFANLPNNAKLEMVTSSRKQGAADSQVRIALQMEDGSRLQDSFSCGQSLWDLLAHFPQIGVSQLSESESTPVCVYMRDEVSGEEALKRATLKSLGLTGGSAIVRFLLKKSKSPGEEDDAEVTETAVTPTYAGAMESTPSTTSQPDPAPPPTETMLTDEPVTDSSTEMPMETLPVPITASATSALPDQQDIIATQEAVQPKNLPLERAVPEKEEEDDGGEAGPSGLSSHASSSASVPPPAPFIPFSGGGQRLGGTAGGGGHSLSSVSCLSAPVVESPKAKKAKSSSSSKSHNNEPGEDMDHGDGLLEPIEREALIYHLDAMTRRTEDHGDLPDEFFEITVDDIRKRFSQLKSERKLLEEAPLMTKSLREAQIKEKMDRYPKVVLRVQFPDRHVLQGFFRPLETVGSVRHFVTSHLENPHLRFYLFITPPKTILDNPSSTLFEADLFPGALVYFGTEETTGFYIKRELLESSVSASQANESIASCMTRASTPPSSSASSVEPSLPSEESSGTCESRTREDGPPSTQTPAPKPSRGDPGKVPKWLKLPGKK